MYNKKYRIEKIEQFNHFNPIYIDVEGSIAYPAYFKVGERGWFLYIENGYLVKEFAHRIHTSVIESVDYVDDCIIVMTQNTRFVFRQVSGREYVEKFGKCPMCWNCPDGCPLEE